MRRFANNRGSATLIAEALVLVVMVVIAIVAYNITQKSKCERSATGANEWMSCESVLDCEQIEKKNKDECKIPDKEKSPK